MSQQSRSELINNAVLFLLDPKVQGSTLKSRIEFLEGKGLNEGEIQEALRRAGPSTGPKSGSGASESIQRRSGFDGRDRDGYGYQSQGQERGAGYGYEYGQMAPLPPQRDWRDLFIMAVISGGVVYGLTALARKYLLPHLRPPTTTTFQQTSQEITNQYDEAQRLLNELTQQTTTLQTNLETDRGRINKVVEEVEEAVRTVKDGEAVWRDEMREVRGEVESIRELVPKMIEKHAATQSSALSDLQSELRSLKTLLVSRQSSLGISPSTSTPNLSSSAANPNGSISATTAAANALLTPKGSGRGIPAWQKVSTPSREGAGSPVGSPLISGSSSLASSGILDGESGGENSSASVKEDGV